MPLKISTATVVVSCISGPSDALLTMWPSLESISIYLPHLHVR